MKLNIIRTHEDAILPTYGTPGAAGLDLHASISQTIYLHPGVRFTCPTGVAVELPDGFEAQIRPRSGLARKNGITVLNSPGTIDPDYRGEIGVILYNAGDEAFAINPGDRIAQMVIAPFVRADLQEVAGLSDSSRGDGGFGSTGK